MPNRDIGDQRRIVPDASIVGFDNRLFAAYLSIPLTPSPIASEVALN